MLPRIWCAHLTADVIHAPLLPQSRCDLRAFYSVGNFRIASGYERGSLSELGISEFEMRAMANGEQSSFKHRRAQILRAARIFADGFRHAARRRGCHLRDVLRLKRAMSFLCLTARA